LKKISKKNPVYIFPKKTLLGKLSHKTLLQFPQKKPYWVIPKKTLLKMFSKKNPVGIFPKKKPYWKSYPNKTLF